MKTLNDNDKHTSKDVIFFSYQRLSDFFMAEELLKPYKTKEEISAAFAQIDVFKKITKGYNWRYYGIIEVFSILLPEKFGLELFELIDYFIENNEENDIDEDEDVNEIENEEYRKNYQVIIIYERFGELLLDSLKWREISSIDEEKIMNWLIIYFYYFRRIYWFYTLTELTAIPNHPFNSDKLHKILMNFSMPERDSFWQNNLRCFSDCDENESTPLIRLIDWAWLPDISFEVDSEIARLVAQTLAWVLSSTDIALRDKTTKVLVNLLEQQSDVLIKTLNAFDEVDDLYISERLYAVAYGCILRTEKNESIKAIAQYIYDTIFKNGNPPTHILLRDYALNAIEYAIYKNVGLVIDENLIRPPYNSEMPILPQSEDDIKMYKIDYDDPERIIDFPFEHNSIYSSLLGLPGDFGRYIVDSQVDHFVPSSFRKKEKANLIKNEERYKHFPVKYWIVKRVFELGYNPKKHAEYDRNISPYNYRHKNKIERIGKKYQWIAFYEILARLADNYLLKDGWGINAECSFYKGAWQLFIRNIDPVYITRNKDDEKKGATKQNEKEWWEDKEYINWNYPNSEWIKMTDELIDPRQVIEKKDLKEEEWVHLKYFIEWKEPKKLGMDKYETGSKQICYFIQGLLVKQSDKQKIIQFLKDKNLWNKLLPEYGDDYSYLFNREKFWSPAYIDIHKNEKTIWESIQNTEYKVIVATEAARGTIEDDKSGANRSYTIPCKFIFEDLKLQYAHIDGTLKKPNGDVIVLNNNNKGVLIRKKELTQFLDNNGLDIIWTLRGEKMFFKNKKYEETLIKVLCGVYYLEDGKLNGKITMYDRHDRE